MGKLLDGSWYQVARISSQESEQSGQPWDSYFYEGKSLSTANKRFAILINNLAYDGNESQPFTPGEPEIARIELRRVRGEKVLEVLDFWQSETRKVFTKGESNLAPVAEKNYAVCCNCGDEFALRNKCIQTREGLLCEECQKIPTQPTAPFAEHDTVKFLPVYASEHIRGKRTHALVLNCLNYGTPSVPNWAMDVQYLTDEGETLRLTPVRAYMIATWQVEKDTRSWVRF